VIIAGAPALGCERDADMFGPLAAAKERWNAGGARPERMSFAACWRMSFPLS
jgi:hypothetical protein